MVYFVDISYFETDVNFSLQSSNFDAVTFVYISLVR